MRLARPREGGDAEREEAAEEDGEETSEPDSAMGVGDLSGGGAGATDLRGFFAGAGRVSLARDLRFGAGRGAAGVGSSTSSTGDGSRTGGTGDRGA